MSDKKEKKFPKTLFVAREYTYPYVSPDSTQMVGHEALESAVTDNDKGNEVAIYQLVSVDNYKKLVTRTSVLEKVDG